jgi:hypothetical protein
VNDRRATRGLRYPADPPTAQEIIAVMRDAAPIATALACTG